MNKVLKEFLQWVLTLIIVMPSAWLVITSHAGAFLSAVASGCLIIIATAVYEVIGVWLKNGES